MTVTVAMYEASLAHIGPRLDALGLDIEVVPFDADGLFHFRDGSVPAAEASVDYLWLSAHIGGRRMRDAVFDIVLACQSVGVVQTFNAGLDHPFYAKASAKGIRLCNSSAQGVAIAEYVMAQVLSLTHPVALQREQQGIKSWAKTPFRELSRTNWLILGYGPIGQEVAQRVKAFGAGTMVVRRTPSPHPHADRVGTGADLPAFLGDADVIVLACPLNATTRGMADADFFAAVKPGAILVNIARGGLIEDAALIDALDTGRIESAVLDVFHTEPLPDSDPLWTHPAVRITPHTSFAGDGVQARWDTLFLDNIARFVRGEPLAQEVDPADL